MFPSLRSLQEISSLRLLELHDKYFEHPLTSKQLHLVLLIAATYTTTNSYLKMFIIHLYLNNNASIQMKLRAS